MITFENLILGKDPEKDVLNCCSGHTVVLWIILG